MRVAVASSLRPGFQACVAQFQTEHPGVRIEAIYGSSGSFFAQISNGAPFDVFLSADREYTEKLVQARLARADSMFLYARGRLVLWISHDNAIEVERLGVASVTEPLVRKIALANPAHAPYGRAAIALLTRAGLYERVREKLVLGENVEQAAHFVKSGSADVAFLPLSLALTLSRGGGRYWLVPESLHGSIDQGGVILSRTERLSEAEALCEFLVSDTGRAILKRHGFESPLE